MYKLDDSFYLRVKEKMQGVWGKIFLVQIIISIIVGMVESSGSIGETILSLSNIDTFVQTGVTIESKVFSLPAALVTIVTSILTVALYMETYKYIKTNKFELVGIFNHIAENPVKVIVVGAIKGLVQVVLGLIPFTGAFISIIIDFGFTYVGYLLLERPDKDYLEYFKDSWKLTTGKKIDLFKIVLHYFLISLIGLGLMLLGVITLLFSVGMDSGAFQSISILIIIVGAIIAIVIAIRNAPYVHLANALYFDEHMQYEGVDLKSL